MVIGDSRIVPHEIEALRAHALSSVLRCIVTLDKGTDPQEFSFSRDESCAYVQCINGEEPYTGYGTVIAKCSQIEE